MAMSQPENMSLDGVLDLIDHLSVQDQAKLRNILLEDQEDIRVALERLAQPGKRWSLEELEQELGLAG